MSTLSVPLAPIKTTVAVKLDQPPPEAGRTGRAGAPAGLPDQKVWHVTLLFAAASRVSWMQTSACSGVTGMVLKIFASKLTYPHLTGSEPAYSRKNGGKGNAFGLGETTTIPKKSTQA